MARIPLIRSDDPEADPEAVALVRAIESRRGDAAFNVQRALANHPELMRSMWAMADIAYFKNSLNPVQRELVYYTAAVTNDCFY